MPARNLQRTKEIGIYSHIYNKGVEKRILFNDEEDNVVFLGFLKDYLSAPQHPDSLKKAFEVHGRTFQGTPHQPKNYFNQVELLAYSLMPDHFHLILHQKTLGSLESFIRSLCTRYSIYYNKKYQRTGSLFEGPYKSVQITDELRLLHLTRYLHSTSKYSSYAEYLGKRETSWVETKVVQSFFEKMKTELFKETDSYKDLVEKYQFDQKGKESIDKIILESENQHLERSNPANDDQNPPTDPPAEFFEKISLNQNLKPHQRIPEMISAAVIFLLLFAVGATNTIPSASNNPKPFTLGAKTTTVSATESPKPTPTPTISKTEEIKPKKILTVTVDDPTVSIYIRQKPTITAKIIGKAKNGENFEFVSEDSDWYGIKFSSESAGFISAKYIKK